MTEESAAAFRREGQPSFSNESTEDDTSADSQSEDDNKEGDTQSPEGDKNTQGDDQKPFHEHPRWTQRESEWNTRFNEQEKRHQDDLKAIRDEFGAKREESKEPKKMPVWFGGTQEQWDAYRQDQEQDLKAAEDRAIKRLETERESKQKAETDAVAEATTYMRSELAAIEGDKTLNPSGTKIDAAVAEKLLKVVLDNKLIDTEQRWNYRAGWKILQGSAAAPKPVAKPSTTEKKNVADATNDKGGSGGDAKPKDYMTASDFKKPGAKPW